MVYLMSGEDHARGVIKEYEQYADTVINHLRSIHLQEYQEFLMHLGIFQANIASKCNWTRDALESVAKKDAKSSSLHMIRAQLEQRHDGRISSIQRLEARWGKEGQ
jgi:sensor domain CHASE-containing protein